MITAQQTADWLKLPAGSHSTDQQLITATQAATEYVAGLPVVQGLADGAAWPAAVQLGATMLAARLYRRRNSANGIEAIGEAGTVFVARHDSDISRLLQLDSAQAPAVG